MFAAVVFIYQLLIYVFVAELIPYPYPHPLLLVFWLLAILSVAGVIFAYGAEFVSYPRLNQRQFDKEKIL